MVDISGDDVELGTGNVGRREFGVLVGRGLRIAGADDKVGRHLQLMQPRLIHPERVDYS